MEACSSVVMFISSSYEHQQKVTKVEGVLESVTQYPPLPEHLVLTVVPLSAHCCSVRFAVLE